MRVKTTIDVDKFYVERLDAECIVSVHFDGLLTRPSLHDPGEDPDAEIVAIEVEDKGELPIPEKVDGSYLSDKEAKEVFDIAYEKMREGAYR